MEDTAELLRRVLEIARHKFEHYGADFNWVIVGEVADALGEQPRAVLDVAYDLESKGCILLRPSPDGNERGAVLRFLRPLLESVEIASTNVFHIGSVGAIQTGSQSSTLVSPAADARSDAESEPYSGPYDPAFTPPFDRLPLTEEMRRCMPSLHLEFGRVLVDEGRIFMAWKLVNVGVGAAKRVRLFIPHLGVDEIGQPLQPAQSIIRKRPYPPDFPHLRSSEDVIVTECEDFAGRQYRQYGRVLQYHVDAERQPHLYGLRSLEMSAPHRVKQAMLREHEPATGIETLPPALESWYFG